MYLIPLSQPESVELVVHALKMAGGDADCSTCPVRKVCMKQCLAIAEAVAKMLASGTLPAMEGDLAAGEAAEPPPETEPPKGRHLKVVK